jgi:hypothetical protein
LFLSPLLFCFLLVFLCFFFNILVFQQ